MACIRSVLLDCPFDQSGVAFFKAFLFSLQFPLMQFSPLHFYRLNGRCRMPHLLQRAKEFHFLTYSGSGLPDTFPNLQAPDCC